LLGWDWYGFQKKGIERRYAKLVFSYAVGYAGHVVHSGASRAWNVRALFFMLVWDWIGFHKKRTRTHYAGDVFCIR
jgi:hypothetical protein